MQTTTDFIGGNHIIGHWGFWILNLLFWKKKCSLKFSRPDIRVKNLKTITVIRVFFVFFPPMVGEMKKSTLKSARIKTPCRHRNGLEPVGTLWCKRTAVNIALLRGQTRHWKPGQKGEQVPCMYFFFFFLFIYYPGALLFYWDNQEEMVSWPQRRAEVTVCNWKQPYSEKVQ